ncbi:site-specific DNA-methyltransferase [Methanoregula sp.]|uniref:site-specific DNA-methyltransferase n=1 Tax=Methanoregula sp. TaxID=2052170 RepID=UPI002CE8C9C5|nr:site-specific DNA-methyltransferase [Methanoregula sp.]HVP96756.1 site-specific DNA-methyltransferase [Methanoregula sp.]
MADDYLKKLQVLLRRLFQFESTDLDFGIYRIINRKRDVIEKFIEKDLIASVDIEFGKISESTKVAAKKELDDLKTTIEKTLGSSAILPSGTFNPQFANTPIGADLAKQYNEKTTAFTAASVSDEHKAEVFNHIYQFFSRYYDNGDFMSMRRYSAKQKFAVPYNGEEVLLHWANKEQYYIKTGEYFFNYAFRVGEYTVRFHVVQAETAMNNTKTENRFFILHTGEGNVSYSDKTKELVILFEYRAMTDSEKATIGTRNVQDTLNEQEKTAILAAIPDIGLRTGLKREIDGKNLVTKHLATYAKRNTTDYFIHKDLEGFLTQELDFYIKNEMIDLDDLGTNKEIPVEHYLNRVRVMKEVSTNIISFLAQIENFQKKLFEKKKFVLIANYCMTLDRVPESFYGEIAKNTNQIVEWKNLYNIGEPGGQATLTGKKSDVIDVEFLKSHLYLVLDTKFFPQEFKDRLLASFDDIDEATGGLLIKSENWQALNILQGRYREQVNCIYIDPPYNTGNDGFLYKDNYQHSSWLAMMGDRIYLSKSFMPSNGIFFTSIGEDEIDRLNTIFTQIFSDAAFISRFIWKSRQNKDNRNVTGVSVDHEYVLCYGTKLRGSLRDESQYTNPDNDPRGPWTSGNMVGLLPQDERPNLHFDLINPDTGINYGKPPMGWRYDKNTMAKLIQEKRIIWPPSPDGRPRRKSFLSELKAQYTGYSSIIAPNVFTTTGTNQMIDLFGNRELAFPKPTLLLEELFTQGSKETGVILDFFAGSGTTAQSVLNLNRRDKGNRRYILIEMGDYFQTIIVPRIKKSVFSSEWKDGKPQNTDGISHMFKYLSLEQYEDTLNNIDFMEGGTVQKTLMDMDGYVLRYMLDFETRESPCRMNVTKLERPFEYTLRITKDSELHDETVDLVETFNYLLGLKVKRIRTFAENGTTYRIVHGETLSGQATTIIWRTTPGLDLKSDKLFIEEKILTDPKFKAERVFINGDFHVEGALPIEPEFQRLMGA